MRCSDLVSFGCLPFFAADRACPSSCVGVLPACLRRCSARGPLTVRGLGDMLTQSRPTSSRECMYCTNSVQRRQWNAISAVAPSRSGRRWKMVVVVLEIVYLVRFEMRGSKTRRHWQGHDGLRRRGKATCDSALHFCVGCCLCPELRDLPCFSAATYQSLACSKPLWELAPPFWKRIHRCEHST